MQELESSSSCSDIGRSSPPPPPPSSSSTNLDTTKSNTLIEMSSQHSPTSCCETGRPIMTDPHTGQTVCSCQVDSRLLSYPRLATGLPVGSLYGSSYSDQGYMSFGTDHSAFYPPLNNSYDLKDGSTAAWSSLTQAAAYYSYDPTMTAYPYSNGYGAMDLNGAARRKNATKEVTSTLKAWLYEHRKNPYPTKGEKIMLAIITKMTLTQVSTWFANARRRLKKENKMTWEPRNRVDDDDKSDVEDNEPTSKDGPDSRTRDDGKDRYGKMNGNLHMYDKCRDSDDLILGKSCTKDSLSLGPDSRSCSPASPLSLSSHTGLSQSSLGALSDPSPSPELSSTSKVIDTKPRIWSLAHTATSNSPPLSRKSPQPSPLHGLTSTHHGAVAAAAHHGFSSLSTGAKVGMGMSMGGMTPTQYHHHHHHQGTTNLTSRPDLRTWIEGTFHGASALTAMGIAAQYHGLVSSANSLGVHYGSATTSGANPCVVGAGGTGTGGVAGVSSGAQGLTPMGASTISGAMMPPVGVHPSATSGVSSSHMNVNRPMVGACTPPSSLDNSSPLSHNMTGSSLACRLAASNVATGLKVGFSSPCANASAIGQSPLMSSMKSSLCSVTGDRVGLNSSLTRTTSQTDVLNTAFRPVTKT